MSTKYGWCLTGDCDTTGSGVPERGGCPVQLGGAPACECACHGGATRGRPLLASRKGPVPVSLLHQLPGTDLPGTAAEGLPAAA